MDPVQGTLTSRCGAGFLRRIAPVMTPECIARIGNKLYGDHNKTIYANMMRAIVRFNNIQGLSKIYDRLRVNLPRAELEVVGRFLRSGRTYRFHSDSAAALVASLFQQTPPDGVKMLYIKEIVFGVRGGAPLMDRTHPCLVALAAVYTGAFLCGVTSKVVLTCLSQVRTRMWFFSRQ
jgi:hypothetical protein